MSIITKVLKLIIFTVLPVSLRFAAGSVVVVVEYGLLTGSELVETAKLPANSRN